MRIFLAGTATLQAYTNQFNNDEKKYVLCTFYEGEEACLKAIKLAGDTEHFLLDSGAFTFMNTKTDIQKEELEAYCDRYCEFIKKYDIKYFFEMDVDYIFGLEYVEELRKRIESKTGKKSIPVWHMSRGIRYWKEMCEKYKYIAVGGLVSSDTNISRKDVVNTLRKLVLYARSKNVKVHGLGFTATKYLKDIAFYSVDSTAWLKTLAFGTSLAKYDEKEHVIINQPVPNNDKTKKPNYKACYENNFNEWLKYQRYMNTQKW